MGPRWLVLTDSDFGIPLTLSRVDNLLESAGEADAAAEDSIRDGSLLTYVFKLDSVYVPHNSRIVEVRHIELESVKQRPSEFQESFGGTSDD